LTKYFLPSFLASFVYFAFGRLTFIKFRLINERAIGGQFDISVSQLNESGSSEEYEDYGPRGGAGRKNGKNGAIG